MKTVGALTVLFSAAVLLPACVVEPTDVASTRDDAITAKSGIDLRGTGSDSDLKIAVKYKVDHDKWSGWNAYLPHAYVTRKGNKAFNCYCNIGGAISVADHTATLSCTKFDADVTDEESIDFEVAVHNGDFSLENVVLHGSKLAAELQTLTGGDPQASRALTAKKDPSDPLANPFAAARVTEDVLSSLVGTSVYSETMGKDRPILRFEYSMNEYFVIGGLAYFIANGIDNNAFGFSPLVEDYHPEKGLVSAETLKQRAMGGFTTAPKCETSGPIGSVANPGPSIDNAMSPLGGPSFGLSDEVELSKVPSVVVAELEKGAAEIEARSFEGTDYSASVNGYYAIHRSCSDSTIVAYVVWGGGAGEPDYQDGVVIGVNLQGKRIYEQEDSG